MKKLSVVSSLFVVVLFLSVTVSATGIHSGFENCRITAVDDIFVGKKIEKVWTLNYNPQESSVTVMKRKTADGTDYMVRSAYFEVCYSLTAEGFGVKKLKPALCNIPCKITKAVIDPKEMEHQRVITPNNVDDKAAVALIASYLPDLLNDAYTHLLN